jgi:hypothetical protein
MKTLVTLALIFTVTFVLLEASGVVIAAASLMLIPNDGWTQIGRMSIETAPWIFFWSMLDN